MSRKKKGPKTAGRFTTGSLLKLFLKGSIHFFILSILSSLVFILMEQLMPQVIRFTVDNVLGSEPAELPAFLRDQIDGMGGIPFLRTHLWVIAIVIIVLAAVGAMFRFAVNIFNNKGAETLMQTMRNNLFAHIQRLPFAWHMKNQTGDIIQRCTSDADRIRIFISEQLVSVLRIVIMVGMSLYFMYSMHVRLALIATASIPVVLLYSAYFHSRIRRHFKEVDENEGILSTIAQENLTGVRVVRAFGREEFERQRFEKQNTHYARLWVKLMGLMAAFWSSGDFISGMQRLMIVVFGSVYCVRGEMSPGDFIAFVAYIGWIIWPVRQLGRMISEMSKAGVSIDRIKYIMNSEPEKDKPGASEPDMRGDIVFDHVSFGYDEQVPVVKDVSFTVKKGTTFGILGGTGSGKSTLMLLLDRLYELPKDGGSITIGGVNINDIKADWLRRNIGMVLQEPFLFSRTIAENIGITQTNMPMDEIRRAAGIACVDDAITEFSKGYDTVVGERGVTLSGGQKQRTAIARMLTQKAPIMVFDDSLSAVDAETDAKIRSALHENLGDSTVILISHRVTTLMQADCILVLDKGRVAEIGTHEELLEKNGIYRQVYDMQQSLSEDVASPQPQISPLNPAEPASKGCTPEEKASPQPQINTAEPALKKDNSANDGKEVTDGE